MSNLGLVLDNIINGTESLCNIDPSGSFGHSLFGPLFSPNRDRSKKRNLKQFLEDFYKKEDYINVPDNVDDEDAEDAENDDEFEECNPEIMTALHGSQFRIDKFFRKILKPHQIEGLQFMWERVYEKKQGCLLAHSMGLGKSIQVISLLTTMYQHLKRNPETNFPTGNRVLILAPLVTLANWVYEFDKWAVNGAENVIGEVYNVSELSANRDGRMRYLKHWYTHGGVMLINYDQFRAMLTTCNKNDKDNYYRYLVNPGADIVILDEAHRIKNSSTLLSSNVKKIRTSTRICLTGYPLQNHLIEYFYMIDFIAPGLLGSRDTFKSFFSMDIEYCYADSSESTKLQAAFKLYVFQLLTSQVTHRRDETILEKYLPPKTEYVVRFKMSPAQNQGYLSMIRSGSIGGPLVGLLVLRSMCNHPKIFHSLLTKRHEKKRNKQLNKLNPDDDDGFIDDSEIMEYIQPQDTEDDNDKAEGESYKVIKETFDADVVEDNEEAAFEKWSSIGFAWAAKYLESADIESWKCSGKMSFVADLAKECKVIGEQIVIVSHSLSCLDYIQHLLPIFGIKTLRLDGSVKAVERQCIIDKFDEDKSIGVMLLSAKAAAIGINVTAANRIVLVDQDWNPLYDEQSIGRIYRYGQTKPVVVYRLITASTIEERIYLQSAHKRSLSKRVIDNKASMIISKEDLVKYFQEPSTNLKLIDLDYFFSEDKDLDWISSSVLKQNKDCITEFHEYEEKVKVDEYQNMTSTLTPCSRKRARNAALNIVANWRNGLAFT